MSHEIDNSKKRTDWDKVSEKLFEASLSHFSHSCDEPTRKSKSRRIRLLVELYIQKATTSDLDAAIEALESGIAQQRDCKPSSFLLTSEMAEQEVAV